MSTLPIAFQCRQYISDCSVHEVVHFKPQMQVLCSFFSSWFSSKTFFVVFVMNKDEIQSRHRMPRPLAWIQYLLLYLVPSFNFKGTLNLFWKSKPLVLAQTILISNTHFPLWTREDIKNVSAEIINLARGQISINPNQKAHQPHNLISTDNYSTQRWTCHLWLEQNAQHVRTVIVTWPQAVPVSETPSSVLGAQCRDLLLQSAHIGSFRPRGNACRISTDCITGRSESVVRIALSRTHLVCRLLCEILRDMLETVSATDRSKLERQEINADKKYVG